MIDNQDNKWITLGFKSSISARGNRFL
ncbi:MAG: hypothetical protein ACI9JN_002808, partial [Bacteroidia bacterium]